MIEAVLTVKSEQGLHARPADLFVRAANRYQSKIRVRNFTSDSGYVNAKSILKILALGVYNGYKIQIAAEGADEVEAVAEIARLINSNFKE